MLNGCNTENTKPIDDFGLFLKNTQTNIVAVSI